ncbi:two component transcriptional regulator, winged helix family [Photobacterium marinum]|uniref:Two component transcriptional regulator, winged helix family n=1 Tax=Photobacterium marinum TaxID=1056511 RepID=L8JAL4_9GAMM|nr:response regulator [Photobacterium marinum]ELR65816.1 two component transcriptional regulator, winged helix family [Photobacterium marinum]
MSKNDDVNVVVLYHKKGFVDILRYILSPYFSALYFEPIGKKQSEKFTSLVAEEKPLLFIYAFEKIEDSVAVKHFLQGSPVGEKIFMHSHASLVLCDKQYRKKAFSVCIDGVFDSYEMIKPIYDNNKIAFTMIKLAELLKLKAEKERLDYQAQLVGKNIQNISDEIGGLKDKYQMAGKKQVNLIEKIITGFNGIFGDVPDNALKREVQKLFNSLESKQLESLLTNLQNNQVGIQLDELRSQSDDFFNELDSDLKKQQTNLSKSHGNGLDGITVVVADDQDFMLKIISTMLEPKGIRVEKASNGVEAILKSKVILPDLVILDIDMPIMNGIETLAAMKHVPQLAEMPVIMLTSYTDIKNFQRCLELGANDYIVKPTNAETMINKISSVLSAH